MSRLALISIIAISLVGPRTQAFALTGAQAPRSATADGAKTITWAPHDERVRLELPVLELQPTPSKVFRRHLGKELAARLGALQDAPAAVTETLMAYRDAEGLYMLCAEADEPCDEAEKLQVAMDRASEKHEATYRKIEERIEALQDALQPPDDGPEKDRRAAAQLLASARLAELSAAVTDIYSENHPAEETVYFGGEIAASGREEAIGAASSYAMAREHLEPGDELAAHAFYGEATHRWRAGEKDAAEGALKALAEAFPAFRRAEVQYQLGCLTAADGPMERAAEHFRAAAAAPQTTSGIERAHVQRALLFAESRLGNWKFALQAGTAAMASKTLTGGGTRRAQRRLVADAFERLGGNPSLLDGAPAEVRARVLGELAVRSLYRDDEAAARRSAEAGLATGAKAGMTDARGVRVALARREGDEETVRRLERGIKRAGIVRHSSVLHALTRSEPSPEQRQREAVLLEGTKGPSPKRRVRALTRLCLESNAWRLGDSPGGEISLVVVAPEGGEPTVTAESVGDAPQLEALVACYRSLPAKAYAPVPGDFTATISFANATSRPEPESILGGGGLKTSIDLAPASGDGVFMRRIDAFDSIGVPPTDPPAGAVDPFGGGGGAGFRLLRKGEEPSPEPSGEPSTEPVEEGTAGKTEKSNNE